MTGFEQLERQLLESVAARQPSPATPKSQRRSSLSAQMQALRRRASSRRGATILLVATLTGSGVGVGVAATYGGGGGVTPAQYDAGVRSRVAGGPSSEDVMVFGIFRRARTTYDELPMQTQADLKVDPSIAGLTGANFSLARRARGLTTGSAWVVPGNGWVCLYTFSSSDGTPSRTGLGGGNCLPDFRAWTGPSVNTGARPDRPGVEFIDGLVPDGIKQITLRWASKTQTVGVRDNVYTALVATGVKSISFRGPAGPSEVRVSP